MMNNLGIRFFHLWYDVTDVAVADVVSSLHRHIFWFYQQQQHIVTAIVTYDGWIIARNCGKGVFRNKITRLPNKFPRKTITMKIFSFSRLLLIFVKPKQFALGLSWKINIFFFGWVWFISLSIRSAKCINVWICKNECLYVFELLVKPK